MEHRMQLFVYFMTEHGLTDYSIEGGRVWYRHIVRCPKCGNDDRVEILLEPDTEWVVPYFRCPCGQEQHLSSEQIAGMIPGEGQ